MTREEAVKQLTINRPSTYTELREAIDMAIKALERQNELFRKGLLKDCESCKALEQEPRKDEVILTKEEYGELVSSEFDIGYTKGYTEALEQNDVLDKIRAEIKDWQTDIHDNEYDAENYDFVFEEIFEIIDKYRESEE